MIILLTSNKPYTGQSETFQRLIEQETPIDFETRKLDPRIVKELNFQDIIIVEGAISINILLQLTAQEVNLQTPHKEGDKIILRDLTVALTDWL